MAYPNSRKLPWFMIPYYITRSTYGGVSTGVSTNLIITTDTVPADVTDTKPLNYYEQQIPGGYTSIYKYGSAGARKISFKLEIADFNDDVGLGLKLAQFDLLRRPEIYVGGVTTKKVETPDLINALGAPVPGTGSTSTVLSQTATKDRRYTPFFSNPYVIYYNSIFNTTPLPFQVLKCDFTTSKPNRLGKPQYAIIDFDLVQMEDHPFSVFEDKAKKALAILGAFGQSVPNLIKSLKNGKSKENVYKNKKSKLGF